MMRFDVEFFGGMLLGFTIAVVICMLLTTKSASAESGIASVYTVKSNGGTRTASGKPFSNGALTAAHRSLPFGTKVKVTNKRNGKSVIVTITDRGPARYLKARIIDLSMAGAQAIGMGYGLAPVIVSRQ